MIDGRRMSRGRGLYLGLQPLSSVGGDGSWNGMNGVGTPRVVY